MADSDTYTSVRERVPFANVGNLDARGGTGKSTDPVITMREIGKSAAAEADAKVQFDRLLAGMRHGNGLGVAVRDELSCSMGRLELPSAPTCEPLEPIEQPQGDLAPKAPGSALHALRAALASKAVPVQALLAAYCSKAVFELRRLAQLSAPLRAALAARISAAFARVKAEPGRVLVELAAAARDLARAHTWKLAAALRAELQVMPLLTLEVDAVKARLAAQLASRPAAQQLATKVQSLLTSANVQLLALGILLQKLLRLPGSPAGGSRSTWESVWSSASRP